MTAKFIGFDAVEQFFCGKTVAIVGSAPSVLDNTPGYIETHDIVVRVNNYKTGMAQGYRCDVHASFYGTSIRKTRHDLERDGVKLCLCKCPDAKALESEWHERTSRQVGIDFRYIYKNRKREDFWFCNTFVPSVKHFVDKFEMLGRHIPTTGFSTVLDVLACHPARVFLTGFDFFTSGLHNVDEKWRPGNPDDPICHRPDLELAWLKANAANHPMLFDKKLQQMMAENV